MNQQVRQPCRQRSQRHTERGNEIIAGEERGTALHRRDLRHHRLVDGQKRGSLGGRDPKGTKECGHQQQWIARRQSKDRARPRHKQCQERERVSPSPGVSQKTDDVGSDHIADQGHGEQHANGCRREPGACEGYAQQHRQQPIGQRAQATHDKDTRRIYLVGSFVTFGHH